MHGKKIVKNSIIGILYNICILVLGFISRKIFITFLGVELLGLNSLYANLLDLLNLADLGIGVAVQYQLYEPIIKKDYKKIASILCAARRIYNLIGCFIIFSGCVLSFFIQHLIKKTTMPLSYVKIAFIISVIGIASGYFGAHKRMFFYANEEISTVNIADMATRVIVVFLSIISMTVFNNYFVYLIINALSGISSNICVNIVFEKKYKHIKMTNSVDTNTINTLLKNLKQVIPLKLSNYVYNSTDNILISKVLGLVTVAKYANYMTLINAIMAVEYLIGNAVTSSIGKMIKENCPAKDLYFFYSTFQYVQYLFSSFCTVSLAVLCRTFITLWIGEDFLIPKICFVILIIEFFIHSMYQPAYVMYGAAGKFKEDKWITIISAFLNLTISLILVIKIGLAGVILGTLATDIYIWAVRTFQVVKEYFKEDIKKYFFKMMSYCLLTAISFLLTYLICCYIKTGSLPADFVLKLIVCCIIPNGINLIFTKNSKEFIYSISYIKNLKK